MLFALPDFMASSESKEDMRPPHPVPLSKSFIIPPPASPDLGARGQRASTFENGPSAGNTADNSPASLENKRPRTQPGAFETTGSGAKDGGPADGTERLPDDFDKLPIELVSLSDRFGLALPEWWRAILTGD